MCLRDRRDGGLFDIDAEEEKDIFEVAKDVGNDISDRDSEDSNRESADGNDYPDESEEEDSDRGYYRGGSSQSSN